MSLEPTVETIIRKVKSSKICALFCVLVIAGIFFLTVGGSDSAAGKEGQTYVRTEAPDVGADPGMEQDEYADYISTSSGLKYKIFQEGNGAVPSRGATVEAHYTGWLDKFESNRKFDSSRDRDHPFTFAVGTGKVIRGWDEAFTSMKVGERRMIIVPPELAYGERGIDDVIPGGATLYFDVELLEIK